MDCPCAQQKKAACSFFNKMFVESEYVPDANALLKRTYRDGYVVPENV